MERAPRGRRLATASRRPSARWQSASASEPSTRMRSASPASPPRPARDARAVWPRARRAAAERGGARRRARSPSTAAPAPAPCDPFLAVAEVVDIAEGDVGHGRAVGDRHRERIERQAALGVEAAVDRVDHDPPAPASAVGALADLLGDERERLAAGRDVVEHGQRRILRGAVDRDREVAAGPAPELVRAALARHRARGGGDAVAHGAADLEPALGRHGSNGSSWLKTIPSRILGKK